MNNYNDRPASTLINQGQGFRVKFQTKGQVSGKNRPIESDRLNSELEKKMLFLNLSQIVLT